MLTQAETAAEPVAGAIAGANKRQRTAADGSVVVTPHSIPTPAVGGSAPAVGGSAPAAAQGATQISQADCSISGCLPVPPKYVQTFDPMHSCGFVMKRSAECCHCLAVWHLLHVCILFCSQISVAKQATIV